MKLSTITTEGIDFEDLFGPDKTGPRPKIVSTSEPQRSRYTMELYRGFDVSIDKLEKRDGFLILSPAKSEQGLIWFTHKFIAVHNPIEYVSGRGSHMLTYPLECIRHYQTIEWDDGSTSTRIPEEILDQTEPISNCRFHMGIELPEGWVFSYKTEKFIGCSINLKITSNMLEKQ